MTTAAPARRTALRRAGALARLARPLNVLMMLGGTAVGGVLAAGGGGLTAAGGGLLLAMGSAAAVGGAANTLNDVVDLEIDRVNRPGRPLPAGEVSVRAARTLASALAALGAGLAALVSLPHLAIALVSLGLLSAYNVRLKGTPFWGNLAVAVVIGLALPFGGLAVGGVTGPLLLGAAFAFGSTFAREVVKDIEDMAGDRAGGARTAPLAVGVRASALAACGAALATGALVAAGPLAGLPASFLVWGLPAAALLLWAGWGALAAADAEGPELRAARAGRASATLKAAMAAGLLALAVAAW